MSRGIRRGAVAMLVSAVLPAVSGVAAAAPAPAEKDTADGYRLKLSIEDANIQSVPNMAGAALVREGFITATSRLEVSCSPPAPTASNGTTAEGRCDPDKLKSGELRPIKTLDMFVQVGCPLDLSGGAAISLQPNLLSSIPVQGVLQAILPPAPNPPPNDITDIAFLPTGGISPELNVPLLPGYIRNVSLGAAKSPLDKNVLDGLKSSMELAATATKLIGGAKPSAQDGNGKPPEESLTERALSALSPDGTEALVVSAKNLHLEVDQTENTLAICGGAAAARIYAQATIRTADSYDTVDIYGDIFTL